MYEKAVELGETRAYEKLKELSNSGLYKIKMQKNLLKR